MTIFGHTIQPARRRFSFASWFGNRSRGALKLYEKSEYGLWAETVNPLHGLTATRAANIFDQARRGVYADLAWLYQELEAADPTLFTCAENREAAVELSDWRVVLSNPERTRGFEENLAVEQQDFLSQAYGAAGDEMGALAAHLERGFFRGFAHARPLYSADGTDLEGFEFYDQWNFARDLDTGAWWWNPDASGIYTDNFRLVPPGELVTLTRTRHIDYPMLDVSIRAAIGEKKYAQWLEKYGIPPVTVIMPQFADKNDEAAYMEAAQKMAAAGSGALPYGSQVNYANDARGTNPFDDHLRHQQELTVLMATGGLLTTLTAPDSGTLAGSAHTDTWLRVVGRDLKSVARATNRTCTTSLLNRKFPGHPHLAGIEFPADKKPSPSTVLEDAGKAKVAGYIVVQSDLEEKTGYALEPDPNAGALNMGGFAHNQPFHAPGTDALANKAPETLRTINASHCNSHGAQITNKGEAQASEPSQSLTEPILSLSQDPIKEALRVIDNGGSATEAMAAYDAAAAAVLTPEKIAEGAEEISKILEAAAKAEKESQS